MSRYLTPAKVGLLALISTYARGVVPTSVTIHVLSFLVQHVITLHGKDPNPAASKPTLTIHEFQKELYELSSGVPGRTVWDLLLKRFWEVDSFDALQHFFDQLSGLLAKTREQLLRDQANGVTDKPGRMRLSRSSPLGIFVRRALVEFTRLQLDDGVALWKSFAAYRESTRSAWRRRNPGAPKAGFDVNLPFGSDAKLYKILYNDALRGSNDLLTSSDDFDTLLEFQIERMQKMSQRLPDEMRDKFREMIASGMTAPHRSHYIKYLDAWKAGDYPSSFDHLHRYFDYTMQSKDRTFYQYALLNLAILQADYGCFSEAVAAMHETISTARENKDSACLNYSLSWLFHFSKAHPEELDNVRQAGVLGTDREALSFLKAKARDAGMWSLLSTTLLAEARQCQLNGESLALSFEGIAKASHLNLTRNLLDGQGSQLNVESSTFSRLGQRFQAWSCNEIFLECYASSSSEEDHLHFLCRAALVESFRGRLSAAFALLEAVTSQSLKTLKHHHFWTACMALLYLRQAICQSDVTSADQYLAQLLANPIQSPDIAFATLLYSIDLQLRKGEYSTAMGILERYQTDNAAAEEDMFQRIKLMSVKAQIFDRAGLPHKGFSIAIRAASLAYKAQHLAILWDAVGVLCKVLIGLSEFHAAVKLLKAIMPQTLETEDCELTARTFSYLADAYMGLAGEAKAGSSKRREQMNKALESLERGFDEYSRIENVDGQCEMLAKKATILHLNGDLVLANDCGAKYLQRRAHEEMISNS